MTLQLSCDVGCDTIWSLLRSPRLHSAELISTISQTYKPVFTWCCKKQSLWRDINHESRRVKHYKRDEMSPFMIMSHHCSDHLMQLFWTDEQLHQVVIQWREKQSWDFDYLIITWYWPRPPPGGLQCPACPGRHRPPWVYTFHNTCNSSTGSNSRSSSPSVDNTLRTKPENIII